MKRRHFEFFFVLVMIAFCSVVFFTGLPFKWKALCITFYGVIILSTVLALWLENRPAQNTLLWTYILVLLPVFGYIFYVYSGQLVVKGELFKSKRMSDRRLFEALRKKQRPLDLSKLNDHQRIFAGYLERVTLTDQNRNTKTKILRNGEETFQEIKQRLMAAKDYIHLEYYRFRNDRLGQELVEILTEKVSEGVEVRLMYDAVGSYSLSGADRKKMLEAGIKVQPFLPIKPVWFNQRFNFRNHRKIIVIDGKIGFIGGLNVGVEYLGEDDKIGFWCDTHVVLEGEAVQTLHAVFLLDWKYVCGEKLFADERYMKPVPAAGDGHVHVVATGPETRDMSDHYFALITSATKSIWIATPYFIPNQAIQTALRVAARKGIQVRLIVPDTNDGFLTQYATQSYFPELLRAGIEIYSYQKGFLHKKVIIVDGDLASIGTANVDMRSFQLNFEVNLFLTGTESIQDLAAQFEEDLMESRRIRPVEFYKRGMAVKWKESFAKLFSGVL
ncbi:cardiolipin synthase [Neobacillus vireti]|uniref:Cardiolipin synthase n=1 Tax=Neobacillus vireti LMG 21834 TaxID=1131730 RepID=A0AB94ISK2_9BACI|nr:cardiolipin synthase [Neobacillus vireti]ETI70016.1 cardiolipin synthetase [Neobacillus vireti LMG 21834]KLT15499.1 cardiolipin synthase [Neobacillus vireti]